MAKIAAAQQENERGRRSEEVPVHRSVRFGSHSQARAALCHKTPPPINSRNMAIIKTARFMFRPVVLLESRPNTNPIATTGITSQLSHPRRGINATSAAIKATIPMSTDITFIVTDLASVSQDTAPSRAVGLLSLHYLSFLTRF